LLRAEACVCFGRFQRESESQRLSDCHRRQTAFASQLLPHATGAFTHWQLGNLRLDLVPALVLGSAAGSAIASRLAIDVDDELLCNLFALYALALGASYLRIGAAMPRVLKGS